MSWMCHSTKRGGGWGGGGGGGCSSCIKKMSVREETREL